MMAGYEIEKARVTLGIVQPNVPDAVKDAGDFLEGSYTRNRIENIEYVLAEIAVVLWNKTDLAAYETQNYETQEERDREEPKYAKQRDLE